MIAETSPILSLLFAKGLGVKTLSQLVDRIVEDELSIEDIISQPANILAERFGLRLTVAEAIQDAHEQADRTAQELEDHGIQILVRGIEPYPNHLVEVLGRNAPPVLFVRGDLSVFGKKAVGFCGARSASEKGIHVASESARQLAEHDVNVVSGYAKGVDLAAHRAAMEAGGVTTIVLAEGILHFRPKRELKSLLDDHNYLVVSEYSPRLPWSGRNAMQRNKTIIGLSDAVICIESGMKGGTHAAAESTLALNLPLFVADYAQPAESAAGNQHFISRGATPLRGDRTGTPNLWRVFDAIGMATPTDLDEIAENEPCPTTVAETAASAREEQEKNKPEVEPLQRSISGNRYPKRLIEVDLPIARISAHSRREKSIRHGHISTLHIWWARRPLAACRAVICASLWPDPADELCPPAFREAAVKQIKQFANRVFPKKLTVEGKLLSSEKHLSFESRGRWEAIAAETLTLDANETADMPILRMCLLDFIADFANWDNSTVPAYLETSRALTQAAHEALGGAPGTRPLVVDPFAGGGSIPLEALRVGADAFASDLNPVAVLLNKVVLEYIPKYGQRLADGVRKWGQWVKEQAEQELAEFYPKDPDGATPIAYLWARTINCEGPSCGAEIPLIRSLWLAKKANRSIAMLLTPHSREKRVCFKIIVKQGRVWVNQNDPNETFSDPTLDGPVKRGSATCPCCGYTTPVAQVRSQLKRRRGGTNDARLFCVATKKSEKKGRTYRLPNSDDKNVVENAATALSARCEQNEGAISLIPNEPIPEGASREGGGSPFTVFIYGMTQWSDLFTSRQLLTLTTLAKLVQSSGTQFTESDNGLRVAIQTCLSLVVNKLADKCSSLCRWKSSAEYMAGNTFSRQALPMVLDFCESNVFGEATGDISAEVDWLIKMLLHGVKSTTHGGQTAEASATQQMLPNDAADAVITDPPYYDAIPYADLSDFFYVWLRRSMHVAGINLAEVPKDQECIVDLSRGKDRAYFEEQMFLALSECRRVLSPGGVGLIVFAHKSTEGWESQLQALLNAGWTITGSWPIDTEMGSRLRAMGSAALASSVHLVCRPRENPDGSLREEIGEWRDVLSELPKRIHEWMPRLAAEGVVGADAIFACLGPALEIFSRYSRVEKASGEAVPLREYLEQVWAAVSTEALSMIFEDADAAGLEPDARLTAMWLWTLGAGVGDSNGNGADDKVTASTGYTLEYDAARKIAQGLGIHLEKNESIVEVKAGKARLLPCSERTRHLFGKEEATATSARGRTKKKEQQRSLFEELDELEAQAEATAGELKPQAGETVLDRVHQSMILFASGRSEALRRFLVEDGAGSDARFWKLAQCLSVLYPKDTDEKRWVDGVLARKKGLGL